VFDVEFPFTVVFNFARFRVEWLAEAISDILFIGALKNFTWFFIFNKFICSPKTFSFAILILTPEYQLSSFIRFADASIEASVVNLTFKTKVALSVMIRNLLQFLSNGLFFLHNGFHSHLIVFSSDLTNQWWYDLSLQTFERSVG
jgi:hypothetical protein